MQSQKCFLWISVGAVCCMLSVVLGAFTAHALKDKLSPYYLGIVGTGAEYQMYHGLAILAVAIAGIACTSLSEEIKCGIRIKWQLICWCFALGIAVFSGSLYALAITQIKILGAITPIGGTLFIVGWLLLAYGALTSYLRMREMQNKLS